MQGSVGNSELGVAGVAGNIGSLNVSDVGAECFLQVSDTITDIIRMSLGNHLDGTVRQVSYHSGQLAASCNAVDGESKADALYTAGKDYMLSSVAHFGAIPFYTELIISK